MRIARTAGSKPALTLLVTAGLLGLAGCGGTDTGTGTAPPEAKPSAAATSVIAPAALTPGEQVPAPEGKPVLTLTGKIQERNTGAKLALDPATLDQLGISKVSTYEPWNKKTMAFQGVWLADLLKVAGTDGAAKGVHATALDDYQIDLTMAEIQAGGIFLATKQGDGNPIPIEDGGPTRIVFVGGVPSGKNADQWIWSLKSLDVR